MPSRIATLFDRIRNARRGDYGASRVDSVVAPPTDLPSACRVLDGQGLFVIGAARTGTTILQNALNADEGVFLFGEPRFHEDPGTPDFATRYNAMHRSWGNQETKSTSCPRLFDEDAAWWRYLAHLAGMYRYVGSKTVINPRHADTECLRIFDFHCRHFHSAHYIFTFRNPLDALMSTRGLAQLHGDTPASHVEVLRAFLLVVRLYFLALRNLPHVHVFFHEAVDPEAFAALGGSLGLPLTHAPAYYDNRKVHRYGLDAVDDGQRPAVAEVAAFYEDFRRSAQAGFDLLQIEQNDNQLDPVHFTPLGRLSWRVTRLLKELNAGTD